MKSLFRFWYVPTKLLLKTPTEELRSISLWLQTLLSTLWLNIFEREWKTRKKHWWTSPGQQSRRRSSVLLRSHLRHCLTHSCMHTWSIILQCLTCLSIRSTKTRESKNTAKYTRVCLITSLSLRIPETLSQSAGFLSCLTSSRLSITSMIPSWTTGWSLNTMPYSTVCFKTAVRSFKAHLI